jgi:hypothetical protein
MVSEAIFGAKRIVRFKNAISGKAVPEELL